MYGHIWPYMDVFIWPYMVTYGHIWPYASLNSIQCFQFCMIAVRSGLSSSRGKQGSHRFMQNGSGHQDDGQKILNSNYFNIVDHFLVSDEPPLALPGSILTSSTSPRPDLNRPAPNNHLFDPIFASRMNKRHYLDPSGPSFAPLELKIWPWDHHREIRLEKLHRIQVRNVSDATLCPVL